MKEYRILISMDDLAEKRNIPEKFWDSNDAEEVIALEIGKEVRTVAKKYIIQFGWPRVGSEAGFVIIDCIFNDDLYHAIVDFYKDLALEIFEAEWKRI